MNECAKYQSKDDVQKTDCLHNDSSKPNGIRTCSVHILCGWRSIQLRPKPQFYWSVHSSARCTWKTICKTCHKKQILVLHGTLWNQKFNYSSNLLNTLLCSDCNNIIRNQNLCVSSDHIFTQKNYTVWIYDNLRASIL